MLFEVVFEILFDVSMGMAERVKFEVNDFILITWETTVLTKDHESHHHYERGEKKLEKIGKRERKENLTQLASRSQYSRQSDTFTGNAQGETHTPIG